VARGVVHRYGRGAGVVALDGASVAVPAGGALALVGESGSGKTTLLRCFNRMVEPTGGVVEVGGRDVRTRPAIALRRHTGYVPQDGGLLPHWRVVRNVALVPTLLGHPEPEADARAALPLSARELVREPRAEPLRRQAGRSPRGRACSCSTSRSAPSTRSRVPTCRPRSPRCGARSR
jgi:osmoprotectant transport system ATP-binding protein